MVVMTQMMSDFTTLPACEYESCENPPFRRGLCYGHESQDRRQGVLKPLRTRRPAIETAQRDELGRKMCRACLEWKPEDCFTRVARRSDGLEGRCRECMRWDGILSKFNLTRQEYEDKLEGQAGTCAICKKVPTKGVNFHIDHDHACCDRIGRSCGECVRSLLCWGCNVALGALQDSPELLRAAADYVEAWRK